MKNIKRSLVIVLCAAIICTLLLFPITVGASSQSVSLGNHMWSIMDDTCGMPSCEANAVAQTEDGYIWIGSYAGLLRYDGTDFDACYLGDDIHDCGIRSLLSDGNKLYIGTNDSGLLIRDGAEISPCPGADVRSVRAFRKSPDGLVYAATDNGIAVISAEGEVSLLQNDALSGVTVLSIDFDKNGIIWGTTANGELFAVRGSEMLYMLPSGSVADGGSLSVLCEGDKIYVGTDSETQAVITLNDDSYSITSYSVQNIETAGCSAVNSFFADSGRI